MDWKPPETAPKNGDIIIADFGWPFAVVACWNAHCEKWTIATQQIEPVNGIWNDPYFESDWENPEDLIAWTDFPSIKATVEECDE